MTDLAVWWHARVLRLRSLPSGALDSVWLRHVHQLLWVKRRKTLHAEFPLLAIGQRGLLDEFELLPRRHVADQSDVQVQSEHGLLGVVSAKPFQFFPRDWSFHLCLAGRFCGKLFLLCAAKCCSHSARFLDLIN